MRIEINIDCADPPALARFWAEVLGATGVRGSGDPYCDLVWPPGSSHPPVNFQLVPEPKAAKNRLHLDLYVDDPEAEIDRIAALGATRVGGRVAGGDACAWWQVMTDPEGNEFCICAGPENSG